MLRCPGELKSFTLLTMSPFFSVLRLMFDFMSSKRLHLGEEVILLGQVTGVRFHSIISPKGEVVSISQEYTETTIYFKQKTVSLLYVQVKNSWKGIHLAVRNVITNYNETCYQGLRKKFFFINFNKYFQDLQNPSSNTTLDLYCEVQNWQITQ